MNMDITNARATINRVMETVGSYGDELDGVDVGEALERLQTYIIELYDVAYTDQTAGVPNRVGFSEKAGAHLHPRHTHERCLCS